MATQAKRIHVSTQLSNTEGSIEFSVFTGIFNGTDFTVNEIRKTITGKIYPVTYLQLSETVLINLNGYVLTISEEVWWDGEIRMPTDVYDSIRTTRGY